MQKDRFLIGILAFIGLLVVAAVALFFVRRQTPSYGAEDTPEGVLRNYVVALQLHDYDRAYGYLANKADKPTREAFLQTFTSHQLDISGSALQIDGAEPSPADQARLDLTVLYGEGGPFSQASSSTWTAVLERQSGAWRIVSLPYPYFNWDWYQPTPAK